MTELTGLTPKTPTLDEVFFADGATKRITETCFDMSDKL